MLFEVPSFNYNLHVFYAISTISFSCLLLNILGFKCEWMTVKDEAIWVGGLGKEWTTTTGVVQNFDPQWVKSIGHMGDVVHFDWVSKYNALRKKGGFEQPGMFFYDTYIVNRIQSNLVITTVNSS